MKRFIVSMSAAISIGCILMGADFKQQVVSKPILKKHCVGYTIIEAGKGIDCHGDTVKLVKKHGFYELASKNLDQAPS
jgi:hypothetical protein